MKNPQARERLLVLSLRYYFGDIPKSSLNEARAEANILLQKYQVPNREAIGYFMETLCQVQLLHYHEAESALIKAIALANKDDDSYLLYACFTHLGFIQTYYGDMISAISSFRIAKKQAALLDDAYMQIIIDINISDLYCKINLYSQALFYINQARSLLVRHHITEPKIKNAINNNQAEIYFRMRNIDSLRQYNKVLNNTSIGTYRLYIYQKRTDYYLSMLSKDYRGAINKLQKLRKDSLFLFDNADEQNLATAYFKSGQLDSAKAIIHHLLSGEAQGNHPELQSNLFETLGQIAENERDYPQAAHDFRIALNQANEQISRLTRVDTIASSIKIDEMEETYIKKTENYKRQQLWMGFTIVVAVLALIIGALAYRSVKRKKYYEQLLFTAEKEELAFSHSHEVRRHLSNIRGIINTIEQSDDRHMAYLEAEEHLLNAADSLDTAIKNISAKLESQS